jgi:hypothetical protein
MLHQLRTHPEFVEGCFGCKAATLTVLNGQVRAFAHANEKELNAYRDARRQGIQPKSTRLPDITAAVRASERIGAPVQVK